MRHPTEGVLRRLLDEPAGVADADREHVAGCAQCLGELAAMREDAALVDAALATEAGADVDVAAAWRRLSTAAPATGTGAPRRRRPGPAGPARSCAARSSRRSPSPSSWPAPAPPPPTTGCRSSGPSRSPRSASAPPTSIALPDLSAYGDARGDRRARRARRSPTRRPRQRRPASTCRRWPTLPRGVSGEPVYQVGGEVSATFTFSAERAAQAAAEAGRGAAAVRRRAWTGARCGWSPARAWPRSGRRAAGVPALVVGRAVAPDGVLLRRPVRDGARLPAVAARPARRRRGAAAHVHRGRLHPAAARARRPGHDVVGARSTACRPRCSPPATGRWRPSCGWTTAW